MLQLQSVILWPELVAQGGSHKNRFWVEARGAIMDVETQLICDKWDGVLGSYCCGLRTSLQQHTKCSFWGHTPLSFNASALNSIPIVVISNWLFQNSSFITAKRQKYQFKNKFQFRYYELGRTYNIYLHRYLHTKHRWGWEVPEISSGHSATWW